MVKIIKTNVFGINVVGSLMNDPFLFLFLI